MDLEIFLKWITWTIIYSFLGILIMFLTYFLLEKFTNASIKKELLEDENIALWIMFGCFFLAIGIIIAAAIV